MGKKIVLLNDLFPDMDMDDDYYDEETEETRVVYRILNIMSDKSYIGKTYSYVGHGKRKSLRYGAIGRFKRHWLNRNSEIAQNECSIFYEALRNSEIHDWFIFTLKVCPKKYLKKWETIMTKKYRTPNSKYGYNYFVGDNKPNDKIYLAKYKSRKAEANVNRAKDGKLRREKHSKNLPSNINYRLSKKKDGTICGEGYFVQIKINGKLYNKAFLSNK